MASVSDLLPYAANARTHSADQVNRIAASIKEFGFNNPILVDGDNGIIAGHGRLAAAKKLGLTEVPTIELSHLSDAQKRAYILADNRLALDAGWDEDVLAAELKRLQEEAFDVALTGFDQAELDKLLGAIAPTEGLTDEDDVPDIDHNTRGVVRGQVWTLGRHRLMCGDSTSESDVGLLTLNQKADMAFTDPPYGVDYDGGVKYLGYGKYDNNTLKRKKLKNDDTPAIYTSVVPVLLNFVDGPLYIWFAATKALELYASLASLSVQIRAMIVWDKIGGYGNPYSTYKQKHEPCLYFSNGADRWIGASNECTVWNLNKGNKNEFHPTQKPVELAERALKNHDAKTVLDLFGGSGSTLIACEKTARTCFMMELDEHYCSVIIERWEKFTGLKATLTSEGDSVAF